MRAASYISRSASADVKSFSSCSNVESVLNFAGQQPRGTCARPKPTAAVRHTHSLPLESAGQLLLVGCVFERRPAGRCAIKPISLSALHFSSKARSRASLTAAVCASLRLCVTCVTCVTLCCARGFTFSSKRNTPRHTGHGCGCCAVLCVKLRFD